MIKKKSSVKLLRFNGKRRSKITTLVNRILAAGRKRKIVSLKNLGVRKADLTREFLLGRVQGWWPDNRDFCLLQFLVEFGYLMKLPPSCLIEEIVLATGCEIDESTEQTNLLLLCAARGFYQELPSWCQTREFMLQVDQNVSPHANALELAAFTGKLGTMPLSKLEVGDLGRHVMRHICAHKEVHLVRHLVQSSDIDCEVLEQCLLNGYFPSCVRNWIRRDMKVAELLGPLNFVFIFAIGRVRL